MKLVGVSDARKQISISRLVAQIIPFRVNLQKHHQQILFGISFFQIIECRVSFSESVINYPTILLSSKRLQSLVAHWINLTYLSAAQAR